MSVTDLTDQDLDEAIDALETGVLNNRQNIAPDKYVALLESHGLIANTRSSGSSHTVITIIPGLGLTRPLVAADSTSVHMYHDQTRPLVTALQELRQERAEQKALAAKDKLSLDNLPDTVERLDVDGTTYLRRVDYPMIALPLDDGDEGRGLRKTINKLTANKKAFRLLLQNLESDDFVFTQDRETRAVRLKHQVYPFEGTIGPFQGGDVENPFKVCAAASNAVEVFDNNLAILPRRESVSAVERTDDTNPGAAVKTVTFPFAILNKYAPEIGHRVLAIDASHFITGESCSYDEKVRPSGRPSAEVYLNAIEAIKGYTDGYEQYLREYAGFELTFSEHVLEARHPFFDDQAFEIAGAIPEQTLNKELQRLKDIPEINVEETDIGTQRTKWQGAIALMQKVLNVSAEAALIKDNVLPLIAAEKEPLAALNTRLIELDVGIERPADFQIGVPQTCKFFIRKWDSINVRILRLKKLPPEDGKMDIFHPQDRKELEGFLDRAERHRQKQHDALATEQAVLDAKRAFAEWMEIPPVPEGTPLSQYPNVLRSSTGVASVFRYSTMAEISGQRAKQHLKQQIKTLTQPKPS